MQSYTITVNLTGEEHRALTAAAQAAQLPVEQYASTLLADHARHVSTGGNGPQPKTARAKATTRR